MATEMRVFREESYDVFIASVCDNWPALGEAGFSKGEVLRAREMAERLRKVAAEHEPTHGRYWPLQGHGKADVHHVATVLAECLDQQKPGAPITIRDYGM